jgi:hypothetical protein
MYESTTPLKTNVGVGEILQVTPSDVNVRIQDIAHDIKVLGSHVGFRSPRSDPKEVRWLEHVYEAKFRLPKGPTPKLLVQHVKSRERPEGRAQKVTQQRIQRQVGMPGRDGRRVCKPRPNQSQYRPEPRPREPIAH